MAVEAGAQALLVQEMGDETDASAEDEEAVEHAHGEVVFGFFGGEGAAVADEVDEADGDAAVDVEDEVVLLGGGDCLDGNGVVEELVRREVLDHVFLDQLDTEVRVGAGLDTVANTGD